MRSVTGENSSVKRELVEKTPTPAPPKSSTAQKTPTPAPPKSSTAQKTPTPAPPKSSTAQKTPIPAPLKSSTAQKTPDKNVVISVTQRPVDQPKPKLKVRKTSNNLRYVAIGVCLLLVAAGITIGIVLGIQDSDTSPPPPVVDKISPSPSHPPPFKSPPPLPLPPGASEVYDISAEFEVSGDIIDFNETSLISEFIEYLNETAVSVNITSGSVNIAVNVRSSSLSRAILYEEKLRGIQSIPIPSLTSRDVSVISVTVVSKIIPAPSPPPPSPSPPGSRGQGAGADDAGRFLLGPHRGAGGAWGGLRTHLHGPRHDQVMGAAPSPMTGPPLS
jgi:hypothetical protein